MKATLGQMLNEAVIPKQWHATDLTRTHWQLGQAHLDQGIHLYRHLKSGPQGCLEGKIYDRQFIIDLWAKDLILYPTNIKISTRCHKPPNKSYFRRSNNSRITVNNGNWLETSISIPQDYKEINLNSPESLDQIIELVEYAESESSAIFKDHEDLISEDEDEDRKERKRRRIKVPRRNRGAR